MSAPVVLEAVDGFLSLLSFTGEAFRVEIDCGPAVRAGDAILGFEPPSRHSGLSHASRHWSLSRRRATLAPRGQMGRLSGLRRH
jgi:hypothetical protein